MPTKRSNGNGDGAATEAQGNGLSFTFTELPPSLNKTLRMHWRTRSDIKAYFAYLFKSGMNLQNVKVAEPVEVDVTWKVMRRMDDDNAKARFKLIGDAMKDAGIVSDDKPEVMHLNEPKQIVVKHRADQGFTVEIREYLPFAEPMPADPLGVRLVKEQNHASN